MVMSTPCRDTVNPRMAISLWVSRCWQLVQPKAETWLWLSPLSKRASRYSWWIGDLDKVRDISCEGPRSRTVSCSCSYLVDTPGIVRCNSFHLTRVPKETSQEPTESTLRKLWLWCKQVLRSDYLRDIETMCCNWLRRGDVVDLLLI